MRLMLAAAAIVPFLSTPALAETWYNTGGNDNVQTYVDLDSLRPLGDKIVGQTLSVYNEPLCGDDENDCNVWAGGIRAEYDCGGNYFRTLEYQFYDRAHEITSIETSATINEQKVPAVGSINEATMEFICYRNGGTAVDNPFDDASLQF